MVEQDNGQGDQSKPKRHNAKLCAPAVRQQVINALANGDSIRAIARGLHVSNNTVVAIRDEEWQQVAARKARIAAQSERNATRAAELIAEKLERGDAPLNVLVPVFGVSVDKALALRADPTIQIEHSHEHIHAHITPMSYQDILARLAKRDAQVEPPRLTADPPGNPDALPSGEATSASVADPPHTAT